MAASPLVYGDGMTPVRNATAAATAVAAALTFAGAAQAAGDGARSAAPPAALGPPTAAGSWAGRVVAPVTARIAPRRTAAARAVVQPIAPLGRGPSVLQVLRVARRPDGTWVQVRLPVRPNGSRGWLPADVLRLRYTSLAVEVDLSARRLTLRRAGRTILTAPVGVGAPGTPTPTGRFAVAEMIRTGTPRGFLGPVVFPLSGYSTRLNEYAGGNGRVALHGTSLPALLPGAVSHGCVRLRNADVLKLARLVRPGTPVHIRR